MLEKSHLPQKTPTTQQNKPRHVTLNIYYLSFSYCHPELRSTTTGVRTFVILGVAHCVEVLYMATTAAVVKSRSPQFLQVQHLLVSEEIAQ